MAKRHQKIRRYLLATFSGHILLFLGLMVVSPEVRAWVKQIFFLPSQNLCLPTDIVGNDLSLEIKSLFRATDKAYWHYRPEQYGMFIRDPSSSDAKIWRRLYLRQIACRIEARKAIGLETDDQVLDRALKRVDKTRQEFELLKPSLLWSRNLEDSDNLS